MPLGAIGLDDITSGGSSADLIKRGRMAESTLSDGNETLRLRLFVSGATPRSLRAVSMLRNLCESCLADRYILEVIDVYRHPTMALQNRIVVVPTLLKMSQDPKRLFIGDMVNMELLAAGLGVSAFPHVPYALP